MVVMVLVDGGLKWHKITHEAHPPRLNLIDLIRYTHKYSSIVKKYCGGVEQDEATNRTN